MNRYFLLIYGLFETFLFTGNILGWSALQSMLLKIGIFQNECLAYNATYNATSQWPCARQARLLNLAFTIGSFCLGATAFAWGFLLDRWGIRIVRLVLNVFLSSGMILLSLTNKNSSYLIFPALILICLAGIPLRLVNLQIAELFPMYRSTVITLYSGAFGASSAVYALLKFGFDQGLPWEWTCSILIFFTIVMLPVTLFLLPTKAFRIPTADTTSIFSIGSGKYLDMPDVASRVLGTYHLIGDDFEKMLAGVNKKKDIEPHWSSKPAVPKLHEKPLQQSVWSFTYLIHLYWFCWVLYFTIYFVGTLHLWTGVTFKDNPHNGIFAETYCLLQATGLVLSPLAGAFMDWRRSGIDKVEDLKARRLNLVLSTFWPLSLTSALAVVVQVTNFFYSSFAIWTAIVFVTLCRIMLLSVGTAYLRIRFPAEHFNRLMGIMSTASAIFSLLQFPLFLWASQEPAQTLIQVSLFNCACLFLACLHPTLILIKPLQRYLMASQESN